MRNIHSKVKKGKKIYSSHSTHQLDLERAKGLTSVRSFKKTPKIATKRDIYKKKAKRDKVNLVSQSLHC